jgi:hypothetical protein
MQTADENNWRDGELVTPAKAAAILGYSLGAVRNMVFDERLRAVRLARSGPMFVTVESLIELLDGAEPAKIKRPRNTVNGPAPLVLLQGGRK